MSRANTDTRPAAPAGDLAAITIGMEHLVLPAAVAYKMLPLLAKAITTDEAYDRKLGYVYRNGQRLRVECKLISRTALQLDKDRNDDSEEPA